MVRRTREGAESTFAAPSRSFPLSALPGISPRGGESSGIRVLLAVVALLLSVGCSGPTPAKTTPAKTTPAKATETAKPAIKPAPGEDKAPEGHSVHGEHEKEKLGADPK